MKVLASRCFQSGEGPSRGLLRDCETYGSSAGSTSNQALGSKQFYKAATHEQLAVEGECSNDDKLRPASPGTDA